MFSQTIGMSNRLSRPRVRDFVAQGIPRSLKLTDDLGTTITGEPQYYPAMVGPDEGDFILTMRERPHPLDWDPSGVESSCSWIERVQTRFQEMGVEDDSSRKAIAAAHLRGEAFDWYITLREELGFTDWKGFVVTLFSFFPPVSAARRVWPSTCIDEPRLSKCV